MQYVGIDWGYRRAAWCAKRHGGKICGEGMVPADEDGLAKLVLALEPSVKACVEMMSGAVWVRDRLTAAGWEVQVADARKVKAVAPLACKTDRVDARVLAELCWRDLVAAVWVPSLDERALRERLKRRMHLVGLRTSAKNRAFGVLTHWGLRIPFDRLVKADGLELLEQHGMLAVWRRSVAEAVAVVDLLDRRLQALDRELEPLARSDPRVVWLETIPGIGPLLGLTLAAEIGDVSRFSTARRRGRPELLAAPEPLASALPRRQPPQRQGQPGQGRGRAQDPHRRLARPHPQRTVQAKPATAGNSTCPGKLPQSSGRLRPGMEMRPRDSSNDNDAQPSAERELSIPQPHPRKESSPTRTAA
jgi:transposase